MKPLPAPQIFMINSSPRYFSLQLHSLYFKADMALGYDFSGIPNPKFRDFLDFFQKIENEKSLNFLGSSGLGFFRVGS